jgi:hypothetical protein
MTKAHAAVSGAEWVTREVSRRPLSPLGRQVANLLADVFGSLCVLEQLDRVDWRRESLLDVPLFRALDTERGNLSRMVVLAHERGLRLTVLPRSTTSLTLRFERAEAESPVLPIARIIGELVVA